MKFELKGKSLYVALSLMDVSMLKNNQMIGDEFPSEYQGDLGKVVFWIQQGKSQDSVKSNFKEGWIYVNLPLEEIDGLEGNFGFKAGKLKKGFQEYDLFFRRDTKYFTFTPPAYSLVG